MPRARNKEERARQVLAWLQANWPIGRPVELRWVDELRDSKKDGGREYDAQTERDGRRIVITLSRRRNRTWRETADSVIHEYVHGRQWPVAGQAEDLIDDHPESFWAEYGARKNDWMYRGGDQDACEFPTR